MVPTPDAKRMAEEAGMDLVEISPNVSPPVCRIMNFGKFQYEESKRKHAAKKKQKQIQIKEVKFRPGTDIGDYQVKLRNLIRFLEERGQGQDHLALPRPRNGPSGIGHAAAETR